jgi:leucyl aminopeptidase (aminopeptidase T)
MADARIEKLAKVLVHYSLGVKKGQWVKVEGSTISAELIKAACLEVLRLGDYERGERGAAPLRRAEPEA